MTLHTHTHTHYMNMINGDLLFFVQQACPLLTDLHLILSFISKVLYKVQTKSDMQTALRLVKYINWCNNQQNVFNRFQYNLIKL